MLKSLTRLMQCLVSLLFSLLIVSGCNTREGQSLGSKHDTTPAEDKVSKTVSPAIMSTTTLLATISNSEAPATPSEHATGESSALTVVFSAYGGGVAYIAQKDDRSYVVHNGKAGRSYQAILDHLAISPDGKHVAYSVNEKGSRRIVVDSKDGSLFEDVWLPTFSPDSEHIAYLAQKNGKSYVVVDDRISSDGCDSYSDNPVFSADSTKVVYAILTQNGGAKLVITDLQLKVLNMRDVLRQPIVMNSAVTRIAAVSTQNGKQRVIDFSLDDPGLVREGALYDSIEYASFGQDGVSLAFAAEKAGKLFVVLKGREEALPDGELRESPVIRPDNKSVGVILATKDGFFLHEAFTGERVKRKKYQEAARLIYSADGRQHAYIARQKKRVFMVANGREEPSVDMIVTPMFSADGKRLVYRARKNEKRFVAVADLNGRVRQYPAYDMVFPVLLTPDGKSIAYGVKDGRKLVWRVDRLDR